MKKIIVTIVAIFLLFSIFSCGIIEINFPENLNLIREKYNTSFTFLSKGESASQHARTSETLYLPWNDSLYMIGTVDNGIYASGDKIPLRFTIGLNDNVLPSGDLCVKITTEDFIVEASNQNLKNNTYVIENFFSADNNQSSPVEFTIFLSPDYADIWAAGTICIDIYYRPHDIDGFMEEMGEYLECSLGIVQEDCIAVGSGEIAYAADSLELWMRRGSSYGNVFDDITKYHYEKKMISTEEMAECCFEFKQKDTVNAYVYRYNETAHTMKIGYFSRNIRYIGEYTISDSKLEEAILSHEAFWNENHYQPAKGGLNVALRILEIMLERGVITDAEYSTELDLIENIQGVHADFSEYNGSFPYTNYQEVDALRETHTD